MSLDINLNEKQSQPLRRFNRPMGSRELVLMIWQRLLWARLAEWDKEIFADE